MIVILRKPLYSRGLRLALLLVFVLLFVSIFVLSTQYAFLVVDNQTIPTSQVHYERGDLIVVRKVSTDKIGVGDVVAYTLIESVDVNETVIHRVSDIITVNYTRYFILMGDSIMNDDVDYDIRSGNYIPEDQIIGVVVAVHYQGRSAQFVTDILSRSSPQKFVVIAVFVLSGLTILLGPNRREKEKEEVVDDGMEIPSLTELLGLWRTAIVGMNWKNKLLAIFLVLMVLTGLLIPRLIAAPVSEDVDVEFSDLVTEIDDGQLSLGLQSYFFLVTVSMDLAFSSLYDTTLTIQLFTDSSLEVPTSNMTTISFKGTSGHIAFSFAIFVHQEYVDCTNFVYKMTVDVINSIGWKIGQNINTALVSFSNGMECGIKNEFKG